MSMIIGCPFERSSNWAWFLEIEGCKHIQVASLLRPEKCDCKHKFVIRLIWQIPVAVPFTVRGSVKTCRMRRWKDVGSKYNVLHTYANRLICHNLFLFDDGGTLHHNGHYDSFRLLYAWASHRLGWHSSTHLTANHTEEIKQGQTRGRVLKGT